MTLFEALILGLIQGLAEFFPISSSAHLKLAKILLHIEDRSHLFDLICHLGTLSAAILFFRKEIANLFRAPKNFLFFFLALLPLVPVYFFLKPLIHAFSEPSYLAPFLFLSSLLLFTASYAKENTEKHPHKFKDVLFIGTMQSMALIPGISRSGSTIAAGLLRGWQVQDAVRFSFLLAIPTVLGGTFLESMKWTAESSASSIGFPAFLLGFLTSFIAGLFSVRLIYWSLSKKRMRPFALYLCFAAGIAYLVT